ncbi:MAG: histidine phosphatase family protein [Candidatus Chisholmbacteria bacterium]|nr:histidine phosphatase family protein [Candidatus Chisholmbacteria bacterium]
MPFKQTKPTILHLIRHGESKANRHGIYQGQSYDVGLTAKGKRQSQSVAETLKVIHFKALYTSPLRRCVETAEIIAQATKGQLIHDPSLLEINHGTWEGKTTQEFNKKEQAMLREWRRNPVGVQMQGGENIAAVVRRCRAFVKSLSPGEYIVVTHDLVIRVIITLAIHHQMRFLWKYTLENCGITTVSFNPYRLIGLNQHFHLNGMQSKLSRQAL